MSDEQHYDAAQHPHTQSDSNNEHWRADNTSVDTQPRSSHSEELERHRQGAGGVHGRPVHEEGYPLAVVEQLVSTAHAGPLPAVEDFAGYEQVLPGSAERLLSMAEKSLDTYHRGADADAQVQYAVARSIDNRGTIDRRQQLLYAIVLVITLLATLTFAWYEKPIPTLLSLVILVVGGAAQYKHNREGFRLFLPSDGKSKDDGQ